MFPLLTYSVSPIIEYNDTGVQNISRDEYLVNSPFKEYLNKNIKVNYCRREERTMAIMATVGAEEGPEQRQRRTKSKGSTGKKRARKAKAAAGRQGDGAAR